MTDDKNKTPQSTPDSQVGSQAAGQQGGRLLDPMQAQAIDAIVNGMIDAQAEGELHRLEQLRRLSLHAGPAFDEAVQARLASQQLLLQAMEVQGTVDVASKVLARVRAERSHAATDKLVAKELRAATLHRLHERNERVREGTEPVAQSFVGPVSSRSLLASLTNESRTNESQGGRHALSVHHRRRLVSSTALAFFAGGVVALALVAIALMQTPRVPGHMHAHGTTRHSHDFAHRHFPDQSLDHSHAQATIPLSLEDLEHRAYFDPAQLPMIEEVPVQGVLRLGNGNQFDQPLKAASASGAGSPSVADMQAQLRLPTVLPSSETPRLAAMDALRDFEMQDLAAKLQLTPQQHRSAIGLLAWGLKPWELPTGDVPMANGK